MANYDSILQKLALQMGVDKAKLTAAIQSGNPQAVANLLSGEKAAAFRQLLSNPQATKNLLNSKQAKEISKNLNK